MVEIEIGTTFHSGSVYDFLKLIPFHRGSKELCSHSGLNYYCRRVGEGVSGWRDCGSWRIAGVNRSTIVLHLYLLANRARLFASKHTHWAINKHFIITLNSFASRSTNNGSAVTAEDKGSRKDRTGGRVDACQLLTYSLRTWRVVLIIQHCE